MAAGWNLPSLSSGIRQRNARLAAIRLKATSQARPDTCPKPPMSLAAFVRESWSVVEPGSVIDWSWHIEAVCFHIETVLTEWAERQFDPSFVQRVHNLLINVPPGCGKSRITCVMTPAWMWTWFPAWSGIFISSNPRVAIRDSVYCRALIASDWYQHKFNPTWTINRKVDSKQVFRNTMGGFRQATGIMSKITGDRADALIVDDPHDAQEVQKSDILRQQVIDRWDTAISNRVNDLRTSVRIGIMQRLHEDDWSGHVLGEAERRQAVLEGKEDAPDEGVGRWCHCRIRQEYEPGDEPNALGWQDPRQEPGELMFPVRFPREQLEAEKRRLGVYGYAGQHQQNPVPAGGGMFCDLVPMESLPSHCHFVRYWDKAGTEGGGAYTAGVLMALTPRGQYVVCDVVRGQWSSGKREEIIYNTAVKDGKEVVIWIEQEPGSAGKESAENTIKNLAGWTAKRENVTGDKVSRARPLAAQTEVGNVFCLHGPWNRALGEEMKLFPNGTYKDQVDACSGAFNKLALMPRPGGAHAIPGRPAPPAPMTGARMGVGLPGQ